MIHVLEYDPIVFVIIKMLIFQVLYIYYSTKKCNWSINIVVERCNFVNEKSGAYNVIQDKTQLFNRKNYDKAWQFYEQLINPGGRVSGVCVL